MNLSLSASLIVPRGDALDALRGEKTRCAHARARVFDTFLNPSLNGDETQTRFPRSGNESAMNLDIPVRDEREPTTRPVALQRRVPFRAMRALLLGKYGAIRATRRTVYAQTWNSVRER